MTRTFACLMKALLTTLLCLILPALVGASEVELKYSKPFAAVDAESIASIVIRIKNSEDALEISDKEWIRALRATITDMDFPLGSGVLGFSLPGEMCSLEFRDANGKPLRVVIVYGAWNLLSARHGTKSVLGSNRRFSEAVVKKLGAWKPEYMREQRKIYRDQISGEYEMEYRDVLKSEQTGTGQPATRPVDEPEGSDQPQPEAEGRSR